MTCMKRILLGITITLLTIINSYAQLPDSAYVYNDSTYQIKKRPWRAGLETFGINAVVWGFNRYIMNEEFARISLKSIKKNFQTGFVWDNDQFSTNLFAHPYHGNLYFNSARSNGLTFWESAPYAFAGSFMWEFFGENEPAAINDFIATSFGGIALGEVTYRISDLLLDDSKRGFGRFWREFLGLAVSPMRGFNRLISGDMWRYRRSHYKYHDFSRIPVKFSLSAGDRYLADDKHFFKGEQSPYMKINMTYGDPLSKEATAPYDYFTINALFNLFGNQPLISELNLMAKLWGKELKTTTGMNMLFGVFQHFNYYDSEEVIDGSGKIPFKISEAAGFGVGMIYKFPTVNKFVTLEQHTHLSGILLGGSLTDYYNVIDRNYNMGSGYSIKNHTIMDFGRYGNFSLNLQHYHIFTWKGYEGKDLENIDPLYLNAQGDKGDAMLTVINPIIGINITSNLKANIEAAYYLRNTHYKYHEDVDFRTFETRLGITYQF